MRITDIVERKLDPGETVQFDDPSVVALQRRINKEYDKLENMHSDPDTTPHAYTMQLEKVKRLRAKLDAVSATVDLNQNYKFFDRLATTIESKCSDIVEYYRELGTVLYRGMDQSKLVVYGKSHDDTNPRMSLDSPAQNHFAISSAMQELGYAARRDNSIFTTSKHGTAAQYGKAYIVFPVDGFSFTWSKKYDDIILRNRRVIKMIDNETFDDLVAEAKRDPEMTRAIALRTQDPDTYPDLNNIIFQWAIDQGYSVHELISPDRVQQYMQFDNKDLSAAISSGHEVYISGAYYAIAEKNSGPLMRRLKIKK